MISQCLIPTWHRLRTGCAESCTLSLQPSVYGHTQKSRPRIPASEAGSALRRATSHYPQAWGRCQSSPSAGSCMLARSSPSCSQISILATLFSGKSSAGKIHHALVMSSNDAQALRKQDSLELHLGMSAAPLSRMQGHCQRCVQ